MNMEVRTMLKIRYFEWQETTNIMGNITHNHLMNVKGPGVGYSIPESHIEVNKLYHMHRKAMLKDQKCSIGTPVDVNGWEDCLEKAKENLVRASMGVVVVIWE